MRRFRHGMARGKKRSEYNCWQTMIARCHRKTASGYPGYGAKGIVVCDRWRHSFENFYADMGDKPGKNYSIDRIDNRGKYSPENCRWASIEQQNGNKSNVHFVEVGGAMMPIAKAAVVTGQNANALYTRYARGERGNDLFVRRREENIMVDLNGETIPLKDAAKKIGIVYGTLYYRYKKGDRGTALFRKPSSVGYRSVSVGVV